MAEIRINGLANTAQTASNDDYVVLDGATNGTRKMLAKKLTEGVEQQLVTTNQNVTQNTEDITDLKADLSDKLNAYTNVDFSIANKRVTSTGTIVTHDGFYVTTYYPCAEGTTVKWYGQSFIYQGSSAMCLVAFYDTNKAFISGITSIEGETKDKIGVVSAVAPANTAYVVAGTHALNDKHYLHVFDVKNTVEGTANEVNTLKNTMKSAEVDIDFFSGKSKKILVKAGATHSSTRDQIEVSIASGEQYVLLFNRNYTNVIEFYAFDANGSYTKIAASAAKAGRYILTAEINIAKVGMTVSANSYDDEYTFGISKAYTNTYVLADKADKAEVDLLQNVIDLDISRNLIGPDLDVLYPVPPLKTGDVLTISAFNPADVNSYAQIRFYASDGTYISYYQFDTSYATSGRQITLNLQNETAYFVSVQHNCGSPLMVERGVKTDFIPHYTTNYEKYLSSASDFGEFELFLPDQAEIIRNSLATARMTKRLCFGHVSDNHSGIYAFICKIIDMSDAKFIVNTGDLVTDKYTDDFARMVEMINAMAKPHYITLGNHDVYKAPSINDAFTKYFDPIKDHNEQPNLDKTYYAVDFAEEGIKCIFLDPYDALTDYSASMETVIAGKMSETQINWFLGQLDAALSAAMHVCVFLHLTPEIVGEKEQKFFDVNTTESTKVTYKFIADVIDAFMDGTAITFNYSGNSYTHTFASSGVFIGYFGGHMHSDCIGKLKTHERQNTFTVTRPWQAPSTNDREGVFRHGSSKWGFSALNYVVVDPHTRHVSIMRVLQQDTKYGFKRDFMTTEY